MVMQLLVRDPRLVIAARKELEGFVDCGLQKARLRTGSRVRYHGIVTFPLTKQSRRAIVVLSVTLGCAATVVACDKMRSQGGPGASGSATTTSSAASTGAAAATGAASNSSCLSGTWNCTLPDSTVAMTITGTAVSAIVKAGPMTMDVTAKFTLDGNEFSIEDTGGKLACQPGVIGTYTYTCSASSLSFGKVSDACEGRAKYLACSFSK